ncbi:G patch domain and KOW motifs-containing protein [Eufriesea mexicana]|uniref:G patch domain and KOW motifs-containing protein n=1 Tax=Eufriesea mexicana TaxID=516756 RepID=A0A310S9I2_9HYME|nr:G patch domain and KOW motifs-containing protein [Eufriesea mexicana]
MAEEGKKISFGFAKSIKKPVLKNTVPQEQKKVDYIECLYEKDIKVIDEEEKKDEPLVIPLLGSKTWHDRILNKIDADIFEPKTNKEKAEDTDVDQKEKSKLSNGSASPKTSVKESEAVENNKIVTLEEQAAKEIIEELKSKEEQETETKDLSLPLVEDQSLRGKEQSTLQDYEKIPVDAFGLAMLRGMGWQPGKGIGKNEKVVSAVIPELRPKGMGLGADKVTLQKKNIDSKKQEEELKIEKGTFVKVIAGKQSNNYGQIEGFDDDAGRLIIKLALGGSTISVNEFMVQPVTKSEYSKNSKILNAKKYEEYKDKESKKFKQKMGRKRRSMSSEHSENFEDNDKSNVDEKIKKCIMHDKTDDKKSKKQKKYSESDNDSNNDHEKRKRNRSSSNSSSSHKSKKSKKSKKHKKHDCSPERSSKKHKKKDKEREKAKNKKSRDYTDRRKHKKRKSRSRSSSKR